MGKFIDFKSINNFQTLSGMKNKDGKCIKENVLFRSANLNKLIPEEMELLKTKYKIKTIIDFRSDTSFTKRRDNVDDYFNLIHIRAVEYLNVITYKVDMGIDPHEFLIKLYTTLALSDDAISNYKKYFDVLLNKEGAFLLHCTSGKDRTGTGINLLLLALGFSIEDIKKEHLNVNKYQEKIYKEFLKTYTPQNQYEKDFYELYYVTKEEFIDLYFKLIIDKYGSTNNYLKEAMNLNDDKINILKKKFLEE